MHVTHCDDDHLIRLSSAEAVSLVDACALLLLAARSTPECQLNPAMSSLLLALFDQFSSYAV